MKDSKTEYTECGKYRELFQKYIEKKIDTVSKISIQSHIAYCEECFKYLDDLIEKQLDKEAADGVVWPDPPSIPPFDLYDKFIRVVIANQWLLIGSFRNLDRLVPMTYLASRRTGTYLVPRKTEKGEKSDVQKILELADEEGFRIGWGVETLRGEGVTAIAYIGGNEHLYVTLHGDEDKTASIPIAICKRKDNRTLDIDKNLIRETDERGHADFGLVDYITWPEPGESYILKVAPKSTE